MANDSRYRALLDVSSAIAQQSSVDAVLRSLRRVLSKIAIFEGAELYLLSDDKKSLHLFAFDRAAEAPAIELGTEIPNAGPTLARVIDEQKPVYLADIGREMLSIPELAPLAPHQGTLNGYAFPVSTSRRRFGILIFAKAQGRECPPEDLELMESVASHVAVALESALATARAEHYHRELAGERDRLRLLLEINNQVAATLDINDVFRSAAASIRSYFSSDFTAFWIISKDSNQLQNPVLDFPGTKGFATEHRTAPLPQEAYEHLRSRHAEIWTAEDANNRLPAELAQTLTAEGIRSMALAALATGTGPLGVLAMGSRKLNAFGQEDTDLLSQIGVQISLALDNALAYGRLNASATRLDEERLYLESEIKSEYNVEDIVGKSSGLRKVLDQVAIVAPTDATVLLHGETGTGKELVARAIHNLSQRRERTFVRLNCAAIPSGLVESELFGHEKGAFTGALIQKRGRFELADHGTLFLDEIGDITLELQPKLLRALQEHEFERLGSTRTIHVDVRLIAATHRDLEAMIRSSQFREDLFYRLNVFPIEIPPLRERREDIPLLVHYFVSRLSRRMQKHIRSIPKAAMDSLVSTDWPGNIRELENFIERCVILTPGDELVVPRSELKRAGGRAIIPASSTFQQAEREVIIEALRNASGKIGGAGGAAERLGLKRTTLQHKMNKLNITRADYSVRPN